MTGLQTDDGEVRRLIALAQERTGDSRQDLYRSIAELFERRGDDLGDIERTIMLEIVERLSREVELSVRTALAERLARQDDAPRDLVRLLASDEIQVAQSVLSHSPVLGDADLIEILHHRTMQHRLAVARRRDLSEDVTAAIVDTGEEDVIVALLNNHDARISAAVLDYLAEESRRVDAYQKPLVRRPDLPEALALRMCAWVSEELKRFIVDSFEVDPSTLDKEIAASLQDVMAERDSSNAAAGTLIDRLEAAGELTPRLLLQTLQQGQITLFEHGFAKLAAMELPALRRVVYDWGDRPFATVCRAVGMDRATFLQVYQLTRKGLDQGARLSKELTVSLCRMYDDVAADAAQMVGPGDGEGPGRAAAH